MTAQHFWDMVSGWFSLENITQDFIKWVIYGIGGAAMLRAYRWSVDYKKKFDRKHEVAFWFVCVPAMMFVLAIGSSIMQNNNVRSASGGVRGKVFRALLSYNEAVKESAMFFVLRGVNNGTPTGVFDWKLTITLPSGQQFLASETPKQDMALGSVDVRSITNSTPGKAMLIIPEEFAKYINNKDNYLPSTLAINPIPTGGGFEGWIAFPLPHGIYKSTIVDGTKMLIQCEQSNNGAIVKIEHHWINSKEAQ